MPKNDFGFLSPKASFKKCVTWLVQAFKNQIIKNNKLRLVMNSVTLKCSNNVLNFSWQISI